MCVEKSEYMYDAAKVKVFFTCRSPETFRLQRNFCEGGIGYEGLYFVMWASDICFEVLYRYIVNALVGFD